MALNCEVRLRRWPFIWADCSFKDRFITTSTFSSYTLYPIDYNYFNCLALIDPKAGISSNFEVDSENHTLTMMTSAYEISKISITLMDL